MTSARRKQKQRTCSHDFTTLSPSMSDNIYSSSLSSLSSLSSMSSSLSSDFYSTFPPPDIYSSSPPDVESYILHGRVARTRWASKKTLEENGVFVQDDERPELPSEWKLQLPMYLAPRYELLLNVSTHISLVE